MAPGIRADPPPPGRRGQPGAFAPGSVRTTSRPEPPATRRWRRSPLASDCDRLLEAVVPPEELIADGYGRDPLHAPLNRLLGPRPQSLLHGIRLDALQHGIRMELAGGRGDQDVVHVAHVTPGGEDLAEAGEGERDDLPRLLGVDRGADRVE